VDDRQPPQTPQQPGWSSGQRILNDAGAREPEHTFHQPVQIVVGIVWEHDGEEHLDTAARTLRRGAGRSGHQIEPPRPAERGEL
jgi:hypothetical protein